MMELSAREDERLTVVILDLRLANPALIALDCSRIRSFKSSGPWGLALAEWSPRSSTPATKRRSKSGSDLVRSGSLFAQKYAITNEWYQSPIQSISMAE
jgi:hypothetical protein